MSSFDKYRVHELAKDFGMTSKAIAEILTKYATAPKNHMQVLEDSELSLVFEYLTQHNQCATMEDLFKVPEAKPAAKKPEPEPQPQAQSQAKPQQSAQPQQAKPQQPQAQQSAQPQQSAKQSAPAKEAKPHVPRQVPEKRVIDTRGGGNVNLGKYDERFDRLAGAHAGDNVKRGKEKFQNKQKQRQQQAAASAKRRAEERDSNERRVEQLCTLFEKNGVAFDRALLPDEEAHLSLSLERDAAREEAFASALLGTAESSDSGGGVSRFTGEYGSCSIRSGGTADALLSRPVDDPESFSKQLFKTFGYTFLTSQLTDGSGSVTGMRSEKGQLIFNASLTLTFSDSSLTGVSGTFLPALGEGRRTDGLDAVDALVHFLDYCSVSGVVCTEVRALDKGYLLQTSSASPLRLQGVWRISTDVSSYYVNCKTGEITRE